MSAGTGRKGFLSWIPRLAAAVLLSSTPVLAETTGKDGLPPALVVVTGARDVVGNPSTEEREPVSVSYEVRTPYPASAVSAEIRGKLEYAGWKPLPRESLGTMHPSSLLAGWRSHVNAFRGSDDRTQSFLWKAEWRNLAGDVVAFTLSYLSKTVSPEGQPAKPDNDTLRVDGTLYKNRLVTLEGLPEALIVLDGAKDVTAWQFKDDQRLGFDLAAPRPPSEAMAAVAKRLEKWGWKSEPEPPPPWRSEGDWAETHKPGWNFGRSGAYAGHMEWRSTWRNRSGSWIRYVFTYAGALPAGATEDPERGVTVYYVEANYSPTGKPNFPFFPPGKARSIKDE